MIKLTDLLKEAQWTSTNTSQPLKGEKPNPNITMDDLAPAPESRPQWPKSDVPKRTIKTGADRTPRSTKFYIGLKVKEKDGDEDFGFVKAVKKNWEEVRNKPIKKEYIGMGTFLTDKNKNEPWYLVQFLNLDPKEEIRGNRFDENNPYNGTPIWYPEEELENVPYGVYKQFSNKKDKWGLR